MLFGLAALSTATTLDDIVIGIFSGSRMMESRILPMSWSWYQLVPSVHVLTDYVPESTWLNILSNRRCNLFFHATDAFAHPLVGTEWGDVWHSVQVRHLYGVAELYDRFPDKQFYFICDDDTFLLPSNLLSLIVTQSLNPSDTHIYGLAYAVPPYMKPFFVSDPNSQASFVHGGAGMLITQGLMRVVGSRLRNCSDIFGLARIGSDARISACARRVGLQTEPEKMCTGFNPQPPMAVMNTFGGESPITFHKIVKEQVGEIFRTIVTESGDGFYDWQNFAFRTNSVELGGTSRWLRLVFGWAICTEEIPTCAQAITQIEITSRHGAMFRQRFNSDVVVYLRCNEMIQGGEIRYVAGLPPPEYGFMLEVICPRLQPFVNRSNGTKQITFETVGYY
jgi:hypothetical protein